jgi:thymidylate synthase (FAD)
VNVKLIWHTPGGDDLIAYMARVSNPANQDNTATAPRLIAYMIRNRHWSPFEMVNMCVEIDTTRDIGRQLLRHSTLRPQEFSQRYQDVGFLDAPPRREARMQHPKNRQMSIQCTDDEIIEWWDEVQTEVINLSNDVYREALDRGIAKEQARAVLPEGLTPTRMYFNGPVRSWLHMCDLRRKPDTQKEARLIAEECWALFKKLYPDTAAAWEIIKAEGPPEAAALRAAVELAEKKFLEYAELHRAKGTPDGNAKAATNEALAQYMRAALTKDN